MVRKNKSKKNEESFGISGFTLGIVSIVVILFNPFLGVLISIVGFSLSLAQQRKKPTKSGKMGIILNIIGFVSNILWWILLATYLLPILQQRLQNPII